MFFFTFKVPIGATKSATGKTSLQSSDKHRSHRYNLSSQEILLILIVPQKLHQSNFSLTLIKSGSVHLISKMMIF